MVEVLTQAFIASFFAATIRMSIPFLMASLGEIFSQRSGVLNLGVEGMMLFGLFGGFVGTFITGSPLAGLIMGIALGGVMALVHAILSIKFYVNQVISGIAINIFALGLTGYLFRIYYSDIFPLPSVGGFESIKIPLLSKIPIIGPSFFSQNILVYAALILVPIIGFILFKTSFGLKIRATGENPRAADILGINVHKIRFLCVIFGGLMAGAAGAYLLLSVPGQVYQQWGVSGRGWISVALVIFSGWNPYRAIVGAFLFGGIDALQLRFQALQVGIPYQFLLMLPYITTLTALIFIAKKVGARGPAALTVPYRR